VAVLLTRLTATIAPRDGAPSINGFIPLFGSRFAVDHRPNQAGMAAVADRLGHRLRRQGPGAVAVPGETTRLPSPIAPGMDEP
jgi:hypothetical protein